jgi:plastocyanin
MIFGCWFLLTGVFAQQLRGEGVEVSAKVLMHTPFRGKKHKETQDLRDAADIVVWLSPLKPGVAASFAPPARQTPYRLVQKNKMFSPHLLVVPAGSQVEFPNEDPFFHNVFSLFNGKRFDLGLYESGTSRSVRFDREGVSYIFCNIHPEMGAVVLALSTPYYNGVVVLHNVLPGSYRLNVWSENGQIEDPAVSEKIVQVSTDPVHLADILLQAATDPLSNHKNKFGEDYKPTQVPKY